jgi:two-component system OmpR family sensor kinase
VTARPWRPQSLFFHTLLLVMGVALALAAVNVGLILFRPPPMGPPLTAYEVARVLRGEAIAKQEPNIRLLRGAQPPAAVEPGNRRDSLIRATIAHYLGLPETDVRFLSAGEPARRLLAGRGDRFSRGGMDRQIEEERQLYERDGQFNPAIFGAFQAAARQRDGNWRVLSRESRDPRERWQSDMIIWTLAFLLLVLPFAWLFSKRIARPIVAFARAAERLGRRQQIEPLELRGPAEIRLAAAAFNGMHARIERYVAERTSMIGAIAHDLRTPLARLAFHLAAAPDRIRERAEAEIAEMDAMISVTLDFVQNETRTQAHEPIDLSLLVEGVVDDFADTGQNAVMTATEPATVNGDWVLLRRLFSNLVKNALVYGGSAEISLRLHGDQAIVEVGDRGPGLSPADLSRAFEPYYRGEGSRNRTTGGVGLGLAIVDVAARVHGGIVELSNRDGGGLCARVTLPVMR